MLHLVLGYLMNRDAIKMDCVNPGTVSVRVVGADVRKLTENGDRLGEITKEFRKDYRDGKIKLSCKRQDIPFGRLTKAGLISYVNYPCAYGLDPTKSEDLTKGENRVQTVY